MRKALHAADGTLLEHGFVDYQPTGGQFVREVAHDFAERTRVRRWNGSAYEDITRTADEIAGEATDRMDRLQFDVLFNQENRIRALELKPAITRAQYRDALIARWKVLNP